MPELPEVETIVRGIAPYLIHQTITRTIIRTPRLRWPIEKHLSRHLNSQVILSVSRRAKYIFIQTPAGYLIIHLGMSGTLQILSKNHELKPHDHFDCVFSNDVVLRFNDPRRFGAILWATNPQSLTIIANLGPEPLSKEFTGKYLFQKTRGRKLAIKNIIMNNQIVVGVGNIYASESLFLAKIHPHTPGNKITLEQANILTQAIKKILTQAIQQGGTTLKDFCQSDGKPGYFNQRLQVYDRKGLPCFSCGNSIHAVKIGQRMSYYCSDCQR